MGKASFTEEAKYLVMEYYNNRVRNLDEAELVFSDVYVVWFCYILGRWKALISTNVQDNMYYEVTYDRDKNVTYIDAYRKIENIEVGPAGTMTPGTAIH